MKKLIQALSILAIFAATAAVSNGAVLFSTGFESDTAGSDPALGSGTGTFSSKTEPTNTVVEVSDAQAKTGTNSVLMSDTTNSGNPSVSKTLSTTINYSVTTVSFDVLKTDITNSVQFNSRIDFNRASDGVKIFDVALSTNGSSLLVINLRNGSSTNVQSFTDSAVSPVFNISGWNNFEYRFDDANDSAKLYVNNTLVLDYNGTLNISYGRFGLNQGFSSYTAGAAYFDNIQITDTIIPEPSSLILLGFSTLGLLTRRKRHA